ncbi:alpha/beta fold hydrolase [Luteibacter aegosomatissinici]|uniref:alpha/beta fold hydrolase n=1 Tax=Luteibacter aegosomatissinici TaxID=2911539 RepID=UPI001FFBCBAF|nr:alpha/beta fold hydrolase [Luteibacter aegosomatissinici]UPG92743.1 alpha/beta fold hydrolase [Luteibacter aegosomatissinici]
MKIASIVALGAMVAAGGAEAATKPTIALVHGAFENAQVWQGVTAQLKADGYTVIAPDLPGRPGNPATPDKVSLDLYRDTVIKAIDKSKTPVVLVGHSFGGIVISDVAEAAPKKVRTLVYLAAYLPKDGESLMSLAQTDADAKIGPHLVIDKEHGVASIERSARADLFANDAPDAVKKMIPDQIIDEPLAPLATPVKLTAAAFGSVDKVYVHTSLDQVVSPSLQARMVAGTPVRSETTLKTGHTPFITDVPGLVKTIEEAASHK